MGSPAGLHAPQLSHGRRARPSHDKPHLALLRYSQSTEKTLSRLLDRNRAALCGVKEYMGAALYTDPNGAARLAANLLACVLSSPKED
jgi:hypothetical protein